ncbi:MAG: UDP-N-acetylmuramoyl-tripeptide--D-alanyl-D-alanine ligase, partial [Clostridiales bacterium]|nr:UDP-N-acetylmuramoyl-tripeptide--D-alanyl-D-alanine ligase [Clostridiales bacterium]
MLKLKICDAAKAVDGKYTADGEFKGVFTDTRKAVKGGLFVALEGEKFDGHDFIGKAEELGAAAVLCRKNINAGIPVIYADDTKKALLNLASYYRGLFDIPVVGITGSVGKTTAKDMTALVAGTKYKTVKTQGNLNNDIGMPMTIFNIDDSTEAAVIEMGMNHKGEISALTAVSRPTAGIITNVGVSHIENLGSRENILKAKLEILEGMKKGSPLILCGDNDLLKTVKNNDYDIMFFGIENTNCPVFADDIVLSEQSTSFKILYNNKKYDVFVPIAGVHNIYNALAAFSAGVKLGVEPEEAIEALKNFEPTGMRQKTEKHGGITFIEDCYNASPDSVKAAVSILMTSEGSRHIAVLGDMLELGDYSENAHRACGELAASKGVDMLFAYGEKSVFTAEGAKNSGMEKVYHFTDPKDLSESLLSTLKPGDAVVFKASRGMKLE